MFHYFIPFFLYVVYKLLFHTSYYLYGFFVQVVIYFNTPHRNIRNNIPYLYETIYQNLLFKNMFWASISLNNFRSVFADKRELLGQTKPSEKPSP